MSAQPQQRQYYVYKRYVAQALMASGFEGQKVPNVMYPDRSAWAFDLSPELAQFIKAYYQDRDKEVPRFIAEYLAAADPEDGEGQGQP